MTLSNGRTSAYQWDYGLSVVTADADGTIARIANEHGSKAFVVEAEDGLYRIPDILLTTGRAVVLYHVSGEEGTSLYTTSEDFLPVSEAPKPDDYIFTEEEIRTWKELDERLTDAEETIVQHTGEIATNASNISQNASAIAQNATDIATNASNIAQNATDINALESSVDSLGTDVNTLETDVNSLGTAVNALETDVDALDNDVNALETDVGLLETAVGALDTGKISDPSTKATGQYLSWDGTAWVAADGGGGGESELFVIQFDDVTSLPTCTGDDIRSAKAAGKTVIVESFTHGAYVPYRIADTPGRAIMLDFTPVEVFSEPVCARLSDESYTWSDQNRTWSRTVFSALVNADGYVKPDSGIPAADLSSAVQTSLGKADSALQAETDPTVPSWAKASTKPAYTASEVGAVPTTRTINGIPLTSNLILGIEELNNVSVVSIGANNTDGGTSLADIKAVYSSTETVLGRYLGSSVLYPLQKMVNEGASTDYALFEGIGGDGQLCKYKRTASKWEHVVYTPVPDTVTVNDYPLSRGYVELRANDVGAMPAPVSAFSPNDGDMIIWDEDNVEWKVKTPVFSDLSDVFVATIGTSGNADGTSFSDISTAYNAGKVVYGVKDGYLLLLTNITSSLARFARATDSNAAQQWQISSDDVWSTTSYTLVHTSRTVNGKALSSDITLNASDVGAISNPATKAADDLLSYNGSAWVAQSVTDTAEKLKDKLIANSGVTSSIPYLFRQSPQNVSAELRKIVGGTLGWNQLCNAASVTLPSGHKYFMMKSGTASVSSSDGTAITGLTSGTDMVIDLTQMFGSTIADAIATMETTTPGSGVAFFRSLFPESYYSYSAPTLQSVQTSARQALDGNGNVIRSYPLDSDLTLRGLPKLTNGQLVYDGDEYLPSGQVTRRYWEFDLGSVTFNQITGYDHLFFYALSSTNTEGHARKYGDNASGVAFQVNGYTFWGNNTSANVYAGVGNMQVAGFATTYSIVIRNDSCSTPAELKTALNGVHIVYPLETPTTETAEPYTEVQLAGTTEQFVSESAVPVGNEAFYAQNTSIGPEDIHAIMDPGTASAGQVLTWNGSSWVAASLPIWNGGVT